MGRDQLIGRDDLLEELLRLLEHHRLISIWGPRGAGKKRLVLEAAHAMRRRDRKARSWRLVDLETASNLPERKRRDSGIEIRQHDSEGGGDEVLVLLAECVDERLLEECARGWLATDDRLQIVVVTTALPHFTSATSLEVGPLDEASAMRLFLTRIREAHPDHEPTASAVERMALACRSVDDLPGGIELLASRHVELSFRASVHRANLLAAPETLDADALAVLAVLSIPTESFGVELASHLVPCVGKDSADTRAILDDLRRRALVRMQGQGPRFRLYASTRLFVNGNVACESLSPFWDRLETIFCKQARLAVGAGQGQVAAQRFLSAERATVQTVFERRTGAGSSPNAILDHPTRAWMAVALEQARAPSPLLAREMLEIDRLAEVLQVDQAAMPPGRDPTTAHDVEALSHALLARARSHLRYGRAELALRDCTLIVDESAKAPASHARSTLHATALVQRARCQLRLGDVEAAAVDSQLAVSIEHDLGNHLGEIRARQDAARCLSSLGDASRAAILYERSAVIARTIGDRRGEARALAGLACQRLDLGDFEEANLLFLQGIELSKQIDDQANGLTFVGYRGLLMLDHARNGDAAELARQASAMARSVGRFIAEAFFRSIVAAAYAGLGKVAEAEEEARIASACLRGGGDVYRDVIDLFISHLDVARARQYFELGLASRGSEVLATLAQRARAARSLAIRHADVRVAVRILERALSNTKNTDTIPTGADRYTASRAPWTIAKDATWIVTPANEKLDLRARRNEQRLLRTLCDLGLRGIASSSDLIRAAWPHVPAPYGRAARNRLHVTLSSLRQLGLKDILMRDANGYRLDPSADILVVD